MSRSMCFFFQAEDGIRVVAVTGVQTCALPILRNHRQTATRTFFVYMTEVEMTGTFIRRSLTICAAALALTAFASVASARSEERRVGKECRVGRSPAPEKEKRERQADGGLGDQT